MKTVIRIAGSMLKNKIGRIVLVILIVAIAVALYACNRSIKTEGVNLTAVSTQVTADIAANRCTPGYTYTNYSNVRSTRCLKVENDWQFQVSYDEGKTWATP